MKVSHAARSTRPNQAYKGLPSAYKVLHSGNKTKPRLLAYIYTKVHDIPNGRRRVGMGIEITVDLFPGEVLLFAIDVMHIRSSKLRG